MTAPERAVTIGPTRSGPAIEIWFHREADKCWEIRAEQGKWGPHFCGERFTSLNAAMERVADYIVTTQF